MEVERGLRPRQVTERGGTASVEGQARPEGLEGGGAVGQHPVQVEGVGEVELGLEPHGAGVVHVLGVQGRVPRVDGEVAVLRVGSRIRSIEVVTLDGFRHEPVELRRADLPGHGGDLDVDPPGCLDSQAGTAWMVASATLRARHAGTRPACT